MMLDVEEVKMEIYVPEEYIEMLRDTLTSLGACIIGNYSHVVSYQESRGYWKPLEDANPYEGNRSEISSGIEMKMEIRCPIANVKEAMNSIKQIHPYEEPLINILPLLNSNFIKKSCLHMIVQTAIF